MSQPTLGDAQVAALQRVAFDYFLYEANPPSELPKMLHFHIESTDRSLRIEKEGRLRSSECVSQRENAEQPSRIASGFDPGGCHA